MNDYVCIVTDYTLIEGHNALSGLGTSGLPDPFISQSKRRSKSSSKPVDYFMYVSDSSSEADDNIERLLSPEKNVEKLNESTPVMAGKSLMKTSVNDSKPLQTDYTIPANSTDLDHRSSPTAGDEYSRKYGDSAVEDDGVEFVNPLLDNEDNQETASEESESEWEKELKLKRDQKAVDQHSSVTPSQQAINQKQAPPVDNEKNSPTDNNSGNEIVVTEPSSHAHSDNNEQIPLETSSKEATRSLKDKTNTAHIQHDRIEDVHLLESSKEQTSSPLPVSPTTLQDMEATKRYKQKQNELLSVLEGRRKQLEDTAKDKTSPTTSSTRVDRELVHIQRPSVNELRSNWESQANKASTNIIPPLDDKRSDKGELEPIKRSPRSSSMTDNSHHLLNKGNDTTTAIEDLFRQPLPAKESSNSEILFNEEVSLPQKVNTHLEPSAVLDETSQLAAKNLELEKRRRAAQSEEQKQQSIIPPPEQSEEEESFSDSKSVEKHYLKSPGMVAGEETKQGEHLHQLQQGKLAEGQDNEDDEYNGHNMDGPNDDVLSSSYQSDQRTTPTDERVLSDNGAQRHLTDNNADDDVLLNRTISPSSQHSTTDLSPTHSTVSPVPFLSSSLPMITSYSRPTSSLLGE